MIVEGTKINISFSYFKNSENILFNYSILKDSNKIKINFRKSEYNCLDIPLDQNYIEKIIKKDAPLIL